MIKISNKQTGLSLIELMLAMILGIFLIAGISTVYLSSKKTYNASNQLSQLDESARIAIKALREHIEHAGYARATLRNFPYILSNSLTTALSCPNGDSNVSNANVIRIAENNYSNDHGDSIGVAFRADNSLMRDCTGTAVPASCLSTSATSMVYNSFWVQVSSSDGYPNLYCGGSRNYMPQPLAQGIENIQFLYGIDQDGAENGWKIDQYKTANDVTSVEWEKVMTVKAALLVRSLERVHDQAERGSYKLFEETITIEPADRYQRAVYTTTIHLRNVVR